MDLDLRQLRYFVAVAEEKHFGRAATRLRIAQPGLSKQIKRLEGSIGVALLVRDKRNVEVTEAGKVLLDYARLAIGVAERAVENTRAAAEGKPGLLKLGGYALAVYPMAGEIVQEFGVRFAHVHLEFVPGHTAQSLDALARRKIDIAITFPPFDEFAPDARYQPLGNLEPVVALPAGHRLAALDEIPRSELLKEPVLTWPRELNVPLVDHLRRTLFGETPHEQLIEVGDVVDMLLRAAAGEGIAIVNPSVVPLGMSNVEFRLLEDRSAFEYGLVWLETGVSRYVSPFIEVAREVVGRSHA